MPKVQAPNQQYLDSLKSLNLPDVHDTPPVELATNRDKLSQVGTHNDVELQDETSTDQFTQAGKIVEQANLANNIASKKASMLANNEFPDYTNFSKKKKLEDGKSEGVRIPFSIIKRIDIMLHEAKMAGEPLTRQDIYCRALSRYLESEGR